VVAARCVDVVAVKVEDGAVGHMALREESSCSVAQAEAAR